MKYLITGGSGFLGKNLIKTLIDKGITDIRVVARNEGDLIEVKEKYNIEIITGDIADDFICDKVCQDIDGIFHLAAYKHVGLAEENVRQCIKSNVIGTLNLLEATRKYKPQFIIGISTDKAARISGVYGSTKFLMERLFSEYEKLNKETKYRIVRYGNVLYSTGSVLCKWKDKLINKEKIQVTDLDSTRFYWTVDKAINLIFDCLDNANNSKPYTCKMKAIKMEDLLNAMMEKYGKSEIEIIGLQKGENKHEIIDANGTDSSQAERYTKEEIMEMI